MDKHNLDDIHLLRLAFYMCDVQLASETGRDVSRAITFLPSEPICDIVFEPCPWVSVFAAVVLW